MAGGVRVELGTICPSSGETTVTPERMPDKVSCFAIRKPSVSTHRLQHDSSVLPFEGRTLPLIPESAVVSFFPGTQLPLRPNR